ncbi:MAG: hypothetical protein Q4B77_05990 [Coriobacteriaceae bacterium]|nr:hypothetical protein [Coriobacteriaceae bacterium]
MMDCSPEHSEMLSFDQMSTVLHRLIKMDLPIQTVVFTGGECTRLGDDLLDMISYANSRGLTTRIVTNAEWATGKDKTFCYLQALREAGLDEINISFDDYHADWVPISNIKRVWTQAAELSFATIAIATCEHGSATVTPDYLRYELGEVIPTYYEPNGDINSDLQDSIEKGKQCRFISNNNLYRLGRARNLRKDEFRQHRCGMVYEGCRDCCRDIVITPEFRVALCCGMRPGAGSIIDIGSAEFESEMSDSEEIFCRYLSELGPYSLLSLLGRVFPHETGKLESINSPCEACESASRLIEKLDCAVEICQAMQEQLDAEHCLDSILGGVKTDARGE